MADTHVQIPKPARKKSYKALIITLVVVFVVAPFLFSVTALALLPSAKLCSGLVRTGNEVSALYTTQPELATYDYHCLGGTPPTAENQYILIGLTSDTTYQSRDAFQNAITAQLTNAGWSPTQMPASQTADESSAVFTKNGYTATATVHSYQPAYGKVKLTPTESPQTNFGFVFEKAPDVPRLLSEEQQLKYATLPIYVPDYVPAGYSEWSVATNQISQTSSAATLIGGEGTVSPRLVMSAVPSEYDITVDRELLTTTSDGILVYTASAASNKNRYNLVAIVGSNLVTLELAYQHPHVNPQLTNDDISQILGSLKQTNTPAK